MIVKEESEKVGLKLSIKKSKIMASGPITSWQIDGKQWKTLFWGGSKIIANGDCSHEIKRHLLLRRKAMTNLDSIFKSWDIILLTNVHLVKAMVFPVVMYGFENWTMKKVERWRTDAFELWSWRWLLRVPSIARRSNQSILKEISPKFIGRTAAEAETPILWPPYANGQLIRKDPDAEKDWRQEEKGMTEDKMIWWHHRLSGYEFEQLREMVKNWEGGLDYCSPWVTKRQDWVTK